MKLKDYLLIILLTIINPFISGYYFGVLDHHHKLPYINKILNSNLYLNDYYFSQPQSLYSFFNYLTVFIHKLTSLSIPWIYLVFYIITLWLLLFAVYRLTFTIYKKPAISLLATSLFLLPKWAAQIGYLTHQFYFVTRDLSLAISLIALNLILTNKLFSSAILIILAFIINPLIPIPLAIFWAFQFFKIKKPLIDKLTNNLSLNKFQLNSFWITALKQRGTYSFPHLWRWTGWGNLSLLLSLLLIPYKFLKSKLFDKFTPALKQFILICLSLFFLQLIIGIISIPFLIQFQLLRAINFVFILGLIAWSAWSYYLLSSKNPYIKLFTLISLITIYFWGIHLTVWHFLLIWLLPSFVLINKPTIKGFKKVSFLKPLIIILITFHAIFKLVYLNPQVNLPYYFHYENPLVDVSSYKNWLDIQVWAKQNTPIDSLFLIPPDLHGFRSFSQRSIVADAKDGGNVFYSKDFSRTWQQRMVDLNQFNSFNLSDFKELQLKYSFNYIVLKSKNNQFTHSPIYQNDSFSIYQL